MRRLPRDVTPVTPTSFTGFSHFDLNSSHLLLEGEGSSVDKLDTL